MLNLDDTVPSSSPSPQRQYQENADDSAATAIPHPPALPQLPQNKDAEAFFGQHLGSHFAQCGRMGTLGIAREVFLSRLVPLFGTCGALHPPYAFRLYATAGGMYPPAVMLAAAATTANNNTSKNNGNDTTNIVAAAAGMRILDPATVRQVAESAFSGMQALYVLFPKALMASALDALAGVGRPLQQQQQQQNPFLHKERPIYVQALMQLPGNEAPIKIVFSNNNNNNSRTKCSVYMVGSHAIIGGRHCTCHAYRFLVLSKGDAAFCKHLLALQFAFGFNVPVTPPEPPGGVGPAARNVADDRRSSNNNAGASSSTGSGGGGDEDDASLLQNDDGEGAQQVRQQRATRSSTTHSVAAGESGGSSSDGANAHSASSAGSPPPTSGNNNTNDNNSSSVTSSGAVLTCSVVATSEEGTVQWISASDDVVISLMTEDA